MKKMYPQEDARKAVMKPSNAMLTAGNGTVIPQYGTVDMPIKFDNSPWTTCKFFVCDTEGPAILSCEASERIGIVSIAKSRSISAVDQPSSSLEPIPDRATLQRMYPDRFEGLGNLPGEYEIELKKDAEPVVTPPRKYPILLKREICEKLREMEQMGVILKCNDNEASEWVSSIAFSRKASGELRVCLDPKHLNAAIKRTHHKTPTIDEISHKLAGTSVYSKLDAKNGYWAIHLMERSSKLCTFQSPAGKYRFKRLPFGLCVSQDIFQSKMDRVLAEVGQGVIGIADDIIVYGEDEKNHDEALHRLMKAAQRNGLVLRLEKCEIRKPAVSFFGLIWTSKGMQPDPRKCDNIAERPAPQNQQELLSFLGLIQYMSPFIPHLAAKTNLLRQLLKKETPWEWSSEHEKAFTEVKRAIDKDMLLHYYDPNIPAEIEVDASLQGLGAALVQNGRPIAFASKSLLPVETRYANIERELLAVVFGLEHFHCFVYGKPVVVKSDHRPLEQIQKKQLSQTPPRLQRMMLRIQPYDATIEYKPGKDLVYADYLSRVKPTQGDVIDIDRTIHTIQISEGQLSRIREATDKDEQLSAVREQVLRGWPESASQVPKLVRPFWSIKDYLSIEDGVLFMSWRMVIPESLRVEFLERIHKGHMGITKSQLRAKESVYWPNMTVDITTHINDCLICLQNAR
jgi:hypothetical protein